MPFKKVGALHGRVVRASALSGCSYAEALRDMVHARLVHGVSSAGYLKQLSATSKPAACEIVHEEAGFKYRIKERGGVRSATVLGRCGRERDVRVPSTLGGIKVTAIAGGAFKNDAALESIEVCEPVEFIGAEAFLGCSGLRRVRLPVDLGVIQRSTFEGCGRLESVVLPYELRRIARDAFKDCVLLASLDHPMKRGISAVKTVDLNLMEKNLPSSLEYIGEGAFAGCLSLSEVNIPFGVRSIPARCFYGCASLKSVGFHNRMTRVGDEAFSGCLNLSMVRVPRKAKYLDCAFDPATHVDAVGSDSSDSSFELRDTAPRLEKVRMVPGTARLASGVPSGDGRCSEEGDERRDLLTVALVGDLMCRSEQQKSAYSAEDDAFDFHETFGAVRDLLRSADITAGNLESMVAPSYALTKDVEYVDDRVYLNAPFEYLDAVRAAGFNVIACAQNHAYDTGARGVLETLESLDRASLKHCGMYAKESDPHFALVEANGFKIGFVAFCDQARQRMKRANFTRHGLDTMFSPFKQERVEADISAARAAGAEFVIAFCHWGREYTMRITDRQSGFAQMVADAGADYLMGSHSHCLQPYSVLKTMDGRIVPVLYSGGNFVSDMTIHMPYNMDTVVVNLMLERAAGGHVRIARESYRACRIVRSHKTRGYVRTVPIGTLYNAADLAGRIRLEEDLLRIKSSLGHLDRFVCDDDGILKDVSPLLESGSFCSKWDCYRVGDASIAPNVQVAASEPAPRFMQVDAGRYASRKPLATREAVVLCAGSVSCDGSLEAGAKTLDGYDFGRTLLHAEACISDCDFAIAALSGSASPSYPSSGSLEGFSAHNGGGYSNVRREIPHALRRAGFDGLALANVFNVCTGVRGLEETVSTCEKAGLIPSGLGESPVSVVDINGVRIAFLSFTHACRGWQNVLSGEGAEALLNIFSLRRCREQVEQSLSLGADAVVTYLSFEEGTTFSARKQLAEQAAEAGSSCVVCVAPKTVSEFYRYTTKSGAVVPIATSLGDFLSGVSDEGHPVPLLRIAFRRTFEGDIQLEEAFVPLKAFPLYDGARNAVCPASRFYNPAYSLADFKGVKTSLGKELGLEIALHDPQTIRIHSRVRNKMTPEDLYRILDAIPSAADLEAFGSAYGSELPCIANRRTDLMKGCAAFLFKAINYQDDKILIRPQDLVDKKVLLVVDTVRHPDIPTIVVDNVSTAYARVCAALRARFDPLTVAITGSVGKTTTKDLVNGVFSTHYKTLCVHGNNNTLSSISQVLQKLDATYGAYVQEVHGGSPGSAKQVSTILRPDIAIITAISEAHLRQMGSMEALVEGKMDIAAGLAPDGILILNNDIERLSQQHPGGVRVCRYSMSDPSCDFYARNISLRERGASFEIVSRGGEFDDAGVYECELNVQGAHNIQNALAAFAAGRIAGIAPHKIVSAIARFKTEGDRQNIVRVDGATFLVDTYSISRSSVLSACEALGRLNPSEGGGRRIAVLGDIVDLGEAAERVHYEVGVELAEYDFDVLLAFGADSPPLVRALRERGRRAYSFKQRDAFNRTLANLIKPGDVVLFKAGTRSHFKEETILPLWGSIAR